MCEWTTLKLRLGFFCQGKAGINLFLVVQSNRLTLTHASGANFGIKPFVIQDFFFEVANREFFCFKVRFCPVKRGNRTGSSRNESGYSRRGTQTSFPLLESRSCRKFGLAPFSIFLLEKKKSVKQSPHFGQLPVFWLHDWKWANVVRNYRNCDSRKSGNWSGYLSVDSQTHSERSRLDFLALRGKN